jgi:hypothetical protein
VKSLSWSDDRGIGYNTPDCAEAVGGSKEREDLSFVGDVCADGIRRASVSLHFGHERVGLPLGFDVTEAHCPTVCSSAHNHLRADAATAASNDEHSGLNRHG